MQEIKRLSLLGLAVAALAVATASPPPAGMKPYKGWVMFPPTGDLPFQDGVAIAECWDNIGGRAVRVAPTTWDLPYPDGDKWIVIVHQLGTITYADGSQLLDNATVTLVFDGAFQLLGLTMETTLTGGTGRFEGASGWASSSGWSEEPIDLATVEPFRARFEGQVSTVGSLKQE